MIVKIEPVLFIVFKPDYRDLVKKHSKNVLLLLPETKLDTILLSSAKYISKLAVELGRSNSKSKTYSEATYSIEETIQANISYCKKLHLSITELD